MGRRVFFSFHFDEDAWRASQVRNMGAIESDEPVSPNDWEAVKRAGNSAIEYWIDQQMGGRTCAVVLVGAQTANRPWVQYEIKKAWNDGLGVVGIRIHGLKNNDQHVSIRGANPFDLFNINGTSLSQIVKLYDPPGFDSKTIYSEIRTNLEALVEDAIRIRSRY